MIGIYQLVHIKSGKRYIGQSVRVEGRKAEHFWTLRHNKHANTYLQAAWNKYGEEAFEFSVLEECAVEQLDEREIYWISFYKSTDPAFGYNLRDGGTWFTEESRRSISTSLKGRKKPEGFADKMRARKGTFSEETKRRIAKGAADWWKTATPEQIEARKQNVSKANKGRKLTQAELEERSCHSKAWWDNATEEQRKERGAAILQGQKEMSEEAKLARCKKIGDANRGRKLGPLSQEVKQKISKSLTGRKIQVDMSPEATARRSENQKRVMADPEARRKLSETVRARYQDPEVKERHRQACIAAMQRRKQQMS